MKNKNLNPEIKQKHRIGILTFLCLFFGLVILILSIIESVAFYLYLNSGGLNISAGGMWFLLLFLLPALFLATLLLVFVSFILTIFKKTRKRRLIVILIGLLLNIFGYTIVYTIFNFVERDTIDARYYIYNQTYLRALVWIKQTIQKYAKAHNGQLPPIKNWSDTLIEFDPNIPDDLTMYSVSRLKESSRYALNSNLAGARLADLPNDVVLFFETKSGKNPVGDRELITAEHHYGRGCIVLFGDLHIEFVKVKDFNNLHWAP